MSDSRWIALHCGDEALALLANHPSAFLLLTQIAMRAKWKDCPITGLKAGEAFIGDWRNAGLHSPKAYQVAKERLEKCQLATFQGGNRGTRATLANSTIFSVSLEAKGKPEDKPTVNKGEAGGKLGGTNHTDTRINGETDTLFSDERKPSESSRLAEEIYQKYPRKEGKPDALRAIIKAMKRHDPAMLMERTIAYAEAIGWKERQFIPHPATWFNGERFNDDPDGWKQPGPSGKPAPMSIEDARKLLGGRGRQGHEETLGDHRQAKAGREYPEPPITKLPRL